MLVWAGSSPCFSVGGPLQRSLWGSAGATEGRVGLRVVGEDENLAQGLLGAGLGGRGLGAAWSPGPGWEDMARWGVGRVGGLCVSSERSRMRQAAWTLIDSVPEARVPGSAQRRGLGEMGSQTVLCAQVVRLCGSD